MNALNSFKNAISPTASLSDISESDDKTIKRKSLKPALVNELMELVVYCKTRKFLGFDKCIGEMFNLCCRIIPI